MSLSPIPGAASAVSLDQLTRPVATPPARGTAPMSNQAIVQAAHKFEAMAIAQLLKPMFASAGSAAAPFSGGAVEKSFRPFFINAVAKSIEARGGLGLAPMIEQALLAERDSTKPQPATATSPSSSVPAPGGSVAPSSSLSPGAGS